MFSGIVQSLVPVSVFENSKNLVRLTLRLVDSSLVNGLSLGASISVDGVCLTVTRIKEQHDYTAISFDIVQETLEKTTLSSLRVDSLVNFERSLKMGDEIGGHFVSGHISTKGKIVKIEQTDFKYVATIQVSPDWAIFLMDKDYIAVDGISLTQVETSKSGLFRLHLIPETLKRTTMGRKKQGDFVNIEFNPQTQAVVTYLKSRNLS